jgi:hypothetical protein
MLPPIDALFTPSGASCAKLAALKTSDSMTAAAKIPFTLMIFLLLFAQFLEAPPGSEYKARSGLPPKSIDAKIGSRTYVVSDQPGSAMASRSKRITRGYQPMPAATARSYERYLKVALALPGAQAAGAPSAKVFHTPSVKVFGKLLSRWRTEAEGALAIRCDFLDRQILLQARPDVFFLTDHYINYPMILVWLEKASQEVLTDVTERAWRLVAPTKAVKQREAATAVLADRNALENKRTRTS